MVIAYGKTLYIIDIGWTWHNNNSTKKITKQMIESLAEYVQNIESDEDIKLSQGNIIVFRNKSITYNWKMWNSVIMNYNA